ncbi:MAG: hypothetical protein F6K58_15305 [Symploca sp. SIO2E9]|nr:hypothetical protein [Symploca sp. SIO2E9]
MSEKRCGEIIKQTLQTLQTRRTQIPRKISFTRVGYERDSSLKTFTEL